MLGWTVRVSPLVLSFVRSIIRLFVHSCVSSRFGRRAWFCQPWITKDPSHLDMYIVVYRMGYCYYYIHIHCMYSTTWGWGCNAAISNAGLTYVGVLIRMYLGRYTHLYYNGYMLCTYGTVILQLPRFQDCSGTELCRPMFSLPHCPRPPSSSFPPSLSNHLLASSVSWFSGTEKRQNGPQQHDGLQITRCRLLVLAGHGRTLTAPLSRASRALSCCSEVMSRYPAVPPGNSARPLRSGVPFLKPPPPPILPRFSSSYLSMPSSIRNIWCVKGRDTHTTPIVEYAICSPTLIPIPIPIPTPIASSTPAQAQAQVDWSRGSFSAARMSRGPPRCRVLEHSPTSLSPSMACHYSRYWLPIFLLFGFLLE